MKKNNFHIKFEELLKKNATEVPEDVWNNISEHLDSEAQKTDSNIEEKKIIDDVWNNIENELDIDESWLKIDLALSNSQASSKRRRLYLRMSAAIFLLLISLASFLYILTPPSDTSLLSNNFRSKILPPDSTIIQKNHPLSFESSSPTPKHVTKIKTTNLTQKKDGQPRYKSTDSFNIQTINKDKQLQTNTEKANFATSESQIHFKFDTLIRKNTSINLSYEMAVKPSLAKPEKTYAEFNWKSEFPLPPIQEHELLAFDRTDSRWSTGITTAIKNTYLLNAETIEGYTPEALNSSQVTILPDFGFNLQYAINKRYILESNLFFSSSSKQSSNTYNFGEYVSKEVDLNYFATEFIIKQNGKNQLFPGKRIIRRNLAGIYVAQLKSATETITSNSNDVKTNYASFDYGLLLGQEIEIRSKGPIKVSAGLSLKYGLPNIYTGNDNIPANLNKTHNGSIEFRIGIAYRWRSNIGIDHYLGLLGTK